ncbi:hypothetical protein fugu_007200 [Takifugu bimaculatus]|uniref:Uncharacterized protein n=1 Tax=Takifugu bimaculatus TaxID=433685 RepID=A0A4Z2B7N0_9TELE|nr:hypothetical protein fugu_007200 [Takifugu bimaculatus]
MDPTKGSNGVNEAYQNLLLLGAIAAASAFVVTILIVLICVGCQRKSKSKHPPAGEKGTSVNMGTLRNPKLNSMSKSDTRLHELHRFPCNGNSVSKSRPGQHGSPAAPQSMLSDGPEALRRAPASPDPHQSPWALPGGRRGAGSRRCWGRSQRPHLHRGGDKKQPDAHPLPG